MTNLIYVRAESNDAGFFLFNHDRYQCSAVDIFEKWTQFQRSNIKQLTETSQECTMIGFGFPK